MAENEFSKTHNGFMPTGITLRQNEVIKSVIRYYCCIEVVFQTTCTKVLERSPGKFERVQSIEQPLHVGTVAASFDPRYTSEEEIIQRVEKEYPGSFYFSKILRQYPDRYVDHVDVYVLPDIDIKTEIEWVGSFNYA